MVRLCLHERAMRKPHCTIPSIEQSNSATTHLFDISQSEIERYGLDLLFALHIYGRTIHLQENSSFF
jgi:hypothetical protein